MFKTKSALSLVSVIALGACVSTPNPIPTGYVYHGQEYKSPLPPESRKVTKAQRQTMGPQQAEQYRNALYDLVENLTERAGLPPKPIHVIPHDPMNVFYAQVDNDLREAMRHQGYTLATSEMDAYYFTYEAMPLEQPGLDPDEYPDAVVDTGNNVEIILQVFDGQGKEATMLTEQRGQYRIDGAEEFFGFQMPSFTMQTAREDR
ncbi:MAG: hypothetical protein AAF569_07635 [Pseudomonadota bacterium]